MKKAELRVIALDTSAVIALVASWHEQHSSTRRALEELASTGHDIAVPAHAVVEAYSVLTRLPAPHRLAPAVAHQLLKDNFADCHTPAMTGASVWKALDAAVTLAVSGGRVHDFIIARSAATLGPCILLTLNTKHFEQFETDALWIRRPESALAG